MAAAGESGKSDCTEAIISGIPSGVTQDHLINFLEFEFPECHIDEADFKKEGTALITFKTPVDMEKLQMVCENSTLEGQRLKAFPLDTRGAVLIRNPSPETTSNCFQFYLSNKKRSGGSNVLNICRDEHDLYLIAYYQSREDAKQVAKRSHTLDNRVLQLELFDPNFDELPDSNEDQFSTPPGEVEPDTTVLPDTYLTQSTETTESDHTSILSGIGAVGSRPEEIPQDLQNAMVPVKKPERCVRKVQGLCPVYQRVLDVFSRSIPDQQLDVEILVEDNCVEIEGEHHEVEKAESLVSCLCEKQTSSMYARDVASNFYGWENVFKEIEDGLGKREYSLVIQEGPFGAEEFYIHLNHSDQSLSFDEFLANYVSWKTVPVKSKEAEELLETSTWEQICEDEIEKELENQVVVVNKRKDHNIEIFGQVALLEQAAKMVEMFLASTLDEQQFNLCDTEKDFLQRFWLKGHHHQTGAGTDFAEMFLEGSCLKIKGYKARARYEATKIKRILDSLKCKRVIYSHPKLASFQHENGDFWMDVVRNTAKENQCLITELPDPLIRDADADGEDWGQWMATVIHSFTLPDQPRELHLVEGKVEELKVDAVVLCCEDSQPQPPSLQAQGARPKTHQPGLEHRSLVQRSEGIQVAQPGGRPCRAVIEVFLQYYFPPGQHRSWESSVENLVADVFRVCHRHQFRSMALPVFGVDVGEDPMPINEAASTLAKCITDQLYSGAGRGSNCLRHLCVCSSRAACLHGLEYALQDNLAWMLSPPSPHSFAFLATDMPKPRTRALNQTSIVVHKGDIARAQVDGLVVPCDIDIDLDLYKSQVTKSLLRGGSVVQTTLQKGSSYSFFRDESIEKRNEDLAEHRVLCGKGGSLKANDIFYVYLPPWGPGAVQTLRDCIEKSLKEATSKRCRTVALTALGVGKLEYPVRYAARTALSAVADFMGKEPSLTQVHFVIYDPTTYEVYDDEHWGLLREHARPVVGMRLPPLQYPHHTDPSHAHAVSPSTTYPAHPSQQPSPPRTRVSYAGVASHSTAFSAYPSPGPSVHRTGGRGHGSHHRVQTHFSYTPYSRPWQDYVMIKSIKLRIKLGDLTSENCDAVVNSTNVDFDFSGGVARAFQKRCDFLVTVCKTDKNQKEMRSKGVVVTSAPGLLCKTVVHLDLERFRRNPKEAVLKCLTTLLYKYPYYKTVAFPALGAGASKYNAPELIVTSMKEALGELKKTRELKEVVVVVSSPDLYRRLTVNLTHPQPMHAPHAYSRQQSAPPSSHMGGTGAPATGAPATGAPATGAPATTPATSSAFSPAASSSVLVTKVPRSKWADPNTLSLFIFSDREEHREEASRKLAEQLELFIGPVRPETVGTKEGDTPGWMSGEDDPQPGCFSNLHWPNPMTLI